MYIIILINASSTKCALFSERGVAPEARPLAGLFLKSSLRAGHIAAPGKLQQLKHGGTAL